MLYVVPLFLLLYLLNLARRRLTTLDAKQHSSNDTTCYPKTARQSTLVRQRQYDCGAPIPGPHAFIGRGVDGRLGLARVPRAAFSDPPASLRCRSSRQRWLNGREGDCLFLRSCIGHHWCGLSNLRLRCGVSGLSLSSHQLLWSQGASPDM